MYARTDGTAAGRILKSVWFSGETSALAEGRTLQIVRLYRYRCRIGGTAGREGYRRWSISDVQAARIGGMVERADYRISWIDSIEINIYVAWTTGRAWRKNRTMRRRINGGRRNEKGLDRCMPVLTKRDRRQGLYLAYIFSNITLAFQCKRGCAGGHLCGRLCDCVCF